MTVYELSATTLIAFAATTFLMNITPGPAVMQVVGHAMSNGWRASQASILGILVANAMYCAFSVLGLGALIIAAPSAFAFIKWCGVSYIIWLGLKSLWSAFSHKDPLNAPALKAKPHSLFRQSFVLRGANPKSVLFFCALLPVFAGEAAGAPNRIAVLGLTAILMEYPVLLAYSLLASRTSTWFKGTSGHRILNALSGSALIVAAGTVARSTLRSR